MEDQEIIGKILDKNPEWRGKAKTYSSISGGLTNRNWRVELEGLQYRIFVKIPGEGTDAWIDRENAVKASRRAYLSGIGPEVLWFDKESGIQVDRYLEGLRPCTNYDFLNRTIWMQAAELLRKFSLSGQLDLTKTLIDAVDEHLAHASDLGINLGIEHSWMHKRYLEAKEVLGVADSEVVPCFNDPIPGNFLVDSDGLSMKIVDYESAANNTRAFEVALLCGEMFHPQRVVDEFVEIYYGYCNESIRAEINVAKGIADYKWGYWALINRKLKSWSFDYYKYGIWKFMRAKRIFRDPRWDRWLSLIECGSR